MFISGQMWNQIRGPPLVHRNAQTGQVVSKNNVWKKKLLLSNQIPFSFQHYCLVSINNFFKKLFLI